MSLIAGGSAGRTWALGAAGLLMLVLGAVWIIAAGQTSTTSAGLPVGRAREPQAWQHSRSQVGVTDIGAATGPGTEHQPDACRRDGRAGDLPAIPSREWASPSAT